MVVCQFSKCLPHCSKYKDPTTIPDNCMVWHDGCNTVTRTIKEEKLQADGSVTVSYENSKVTPYVCSPIATGEAKCL